MKDVVFYLAINKTHILKWIKSKTKTVEVALK